jgi:hypothetical protein
MVDRTLKGLKTKLYIPVKPLPYIDMSGNFCWKNKNFGQNLDGTANIQSLASQIPCSYNHKVHCLCGKIGDVIYVKETWAYSYECSHYNHLHSDDCNFLYKASDSCVDKWRSSTTMPKDATRIFLEITNVNILKINKIKESDVIAFGFSRLSKDGGRTYKYGISDRDGLPGNDDFGWHWKDWEVDHLRAFAKLWNSKYKKEELKFNKSPYVWDIDYKIINKEELK